MIVIQDISKIKLQNTIVTLGKFDGFHIGHQKLIRAAQELRLPGMQTVVFTFDMNPAMLAGGANAASIQARAERNAAIYPADVDYVIEFPFNKKTMSMEPEQFVRDILVERLGVKYIVAGYDFRFGRNRAGDIQTLQELGGTYGFAVKVVDKVTIRPEGYEEPVEVSSTLIKEEIRLGHMENVCRMLGRPFCVTGVVEHGRHLGSGMGFPTANLQVPADKVMPPNGVYATRTRVHGQPDGTTPEQGQPDAAASQQGQPDDAGYISITNIGQRPTFHDGRHATVETNIFDFDRDLYGRTITVEFYHFVRPERRFDSPQELIDEIAENKKTVAEYFRRQD